jgi:hypothetical protein
MQVSEIQAALEVELSLAATTQWTELFRGPHLRRTLIVMRTAMTLIASGILFLAAYGVYFFSIAGSTEPFRDNIILLCLGILAGWSSIIFNRIFGRRTIMIVGGITGGLAMMCVDVPIHSRSNRSSFTQNSCRFRCDLYVYVRSTHVPI